MITVTLTRSTISSIPTAALLEWWNKHSGLGFDLELPTPCTARQRADLEDRCLNLLDNEGLLRYASGLRYSGGQLTEKRVGEGAGEIVVKPDGAKVRRYTKVRTIQIMTGGKWVNRKVLPKVTWDPTTTELSIVERRSSSSDAGIHSIVLTITHDATSSTINFPSIAACLRHMIASDQQLAGMDWTIAGKIRAMLLAKKEQVRIREALASTRAWLDRKPRSPRLFEKYTINLAGEHK